MALAAAVFDLDGTLVDSLDDLAASVGEVLRALGLRPVSRAEVRRFVGEGARSLVARSLAAAGSDVDVDAVMPRWQGVYAAHLLDRTRLYDGIAEVLAAAPKACGVLTNKPGAPARAIVHGLGLAARFSSVLGGDDAPKKPDPAGLLALCHSMDAAPAATALIGDSPLDVATARAAGTVAIAVAWGFTDETLLAAAGPDYLCRTPAELAALLRRL